jgi:hypothetical protein
MSVISYPLTGEYGKDKHVLIDEEFLGKCKDTGYSQNVSTMRCMIVD